MPTEPLRRAIYVPKGAALEYAPLALNPYEGCGHGCLYCYVPAAIRMMPDLFHSGAVEKPLFREALLRDARRLLRAGRHEQIFLCFATDPWHPGDTILTRDSLEILIECDQSFACLSKGGLKALRDLPLFRRERDSFSVTLIAADDAYARKWETKATPPSERLITLRRFYEAGIFCWPSIEPVIDDQHALAAIQAALPFADHFKIGLLSKVRLPRQFDRREFVLRVIDILSRAGKTGYFKDSLSEHIPHDWPNNLRIQQHH